MVGRGLGGAAVLNLAAGVVGALVSLLTAALVGRHLGVAGAGQYYLVVAAFMIAANTVELGADTGLVRCVAAARALRRREEIPVLLRSAVVPVLVAAGLLVVATAAVVLAVDPFDDISPLLLVLASVVAGALALAAVLLGFTRGFGDTRAYPTLQNLVLPLGRLAAIGVAIVAGWEVSGVLAAWFSPVPLVLALAAVVVFRHIKRAGPPAETLDPAGRRRIHWSFWRFSAARGVTACVEILLEWVDVLLVGALTSPAAAGVYAVVTRCLRASEVVQQAARIVVGPEVSAALAHGDVDRARDLYGLVTAAMIWAAWPFFILIAVFGDQVLRLFGPGFDAGAVPMAVLAIAMALATAAGTVQTILLMSGHSAWQLADKTGALVLNVVLDLLLIPWWGITGAAIAWATTIVVDTAVVVWQVQNVMGVRPSGRRHLVSAVIQSVVLVALPAVAVRLVLGSTAATAAGATVVLGALYLAVGWKTRSALGLTRLMALRSSLTH